VEDPGTGRDRDLEWVDWFNHRRLNSYRDDMPPAELEAAHYRHHQTRPPAEVSTV